MASQAAGLADLAGAPATSVAILGPPVSHHLQGLPDSKQDPRHSGFPKKPFPGEPRLPEPPARVPTMARVAGS